NRGQGMAVHSYVYVEVKDCIARFPIFVERSGIPPDENYFGFRVQVFDGPAWIAWSKRHLGDRKDEWIDDQSPPPLAKPAQYLWDFGDGVKSSTPESQINHRFPAEVDRPDERATFYTVRVDAQDARGQSMATGTVSVQLNNGMHQLKREQGRLQLISKVAP